APGARIAPDAPYVRRHFRPRRGRTEVAGSDHGWTVIGPLRPRAVGAYAECREASSTTEDLKWLATPTSPQQPAEPSQRQPATSARIRPVGDSPRVPRRTAPAQWFWGVQRTSTP